MKERYKKFTVRIKDPETIEGNYILFHKVYINRAVPARKKSMLELYKQFMIGIN